MVAVPVRSDDAVDLVNGDLESSDVADKRERVGSGVE